MVGVLPAMLWLVLALLVSLPAGAETALLTVTGKIAPADGEQSIVFDRAQLEALGLTEVRTSTAWTDGVSVFEGVLARDVMTAVGAAGDSVLARALNDYQVVIPLADFRDYPVLLALTMDGRELRLRDKGPIWIVYPRDDFPELRSEIVNSRWVWNLWGLEVR